MVTSHLGLGSQLVAAETAPSGHNMGVLDESIQVEEFPSLFDWSNGNPLGPTPGGYYAQRPKKT